MQSRLAARYASVIDVLERVLDKGIVLDAWARASRAGIDLLTQNARIVIASITTRRGVHDAPPAIGPVAPPGSAELRPESDMSRRTRRAADGDE